MSEKRKPTVGQGVHYWPDGQVIAGVQPEAAIVAFVHPVNVHSPTLVNLFVMNHHGREYSEESVRLMQDGETLPEHRYATFLDGGGRQASPAEAVRAK